MAQSVAEAQRVRQVALRQRRPVPHSLSRVHWPAGLAAHRPLAASQVCPEGQGLEALQEARHSWFTQTRPTPHWELKRHALEGTVHWPERQTWPLLQLASEVHAQLEVAPSQVRRAQVPSRQTAPPMHWELSRQVPGLRVGSDSVGATQTPRVVPDAPRQTQPWEQSASLRHEVAQPRLVQTWPAEHW